MEHDRGFLYTVGKPLAKERLSAMLDQTAPYPIIETKTE